MITPIRRGLQILQVLRAVPLEAILKPSALRQLTFDLTPAKECSICV